MNLCCDEESILTLTGCHNRAVYTTVRSDCLEPKWVWCCRRYFGRHLTVRYLSIDQVNSLIDGRMERRWQKTVASMQYSLDPHRRSNESLVLMSISCIIMMTGTFLFEAAQAYVSIVGSVGFTFSIRMSDERNEDAWSHEASWHTPSMSSGEIGALKPTSRTVLSGANLVLVVAGGAMRYSRADGVVGLDLNGIVSVQQQVS